MDSYLFGLFRLCVIRSFVRRSSALSSSSPLFIRLLLRLLLALTGFLPFLILLFLPILPLHHPISHFPPHPLLLRRIPLFLIFLLLFRYLLFLNPSDLFSSFRFFTISDVSLLSFLTSNTLVPLSLACAHGLIFSVFYVAQIQ